MGFDGMGNGGGSGVGGGIWAKISPPTTPPDGFPARKELVQTGFSFFSFLFFVILIAMFPKVCWRVFWDDEIMKKGEVGGDENLLFLLLLTSEEERWNWRGVRPGGGGEECGGKVGWERRGEGVAKPAWILSAQQKILGKGGGGGGGKGPLTSDGNGGVRYGGIWGRRGRRRRN